MRTKTGLRVLGLVLGTLAVTGTAAAEEIAPPATQASVLLKALEFDRSVEAESGDFVIAVMWNRSNKSSEAWSLDMQKAFEGSKTFRQRTIRVTRIEAGQGELKKSLEAAKASAVYLAPGTESVASEVCAIAKEASLATLGASRDLAKECVAVTVVLEDRKPKIVVNLPRSKEQGMDLGANLLRLAEVIR